MSAFLMFSAAELVEGFIKRYDTLPVRELWLVDIEEGREKLEIVGALAKRMVKKAGVPMEIKLSPARCRFCHDPDEGWAPACPFAG